MAPSVSVILPTYNRSGSLHAAISSVLTQSYSDLELIVVDDGSSEDIEGLVRGIGDPRIVFIRRTKNGGAAAARNTGVAHAKGTYIAFQDSDDLWLPGKLERQIGFFSKLPDDVGVVTGGKLLYGRDARFNFGHGRVAYAPPPESILRLDEDQVAHLLTENRISLQNTLFKKKHIADTVWFDSSAKANEDWDFAIRLVQKTRVYEDREPVVIGFLSPDSISSNFRGQTIGILRILKKNRALLERYKKQRSIMLIDVAAALFRANKPKRSFSFLVAGLKDYPSNAGLVPRAFGRPVKSRLASLLRWERRGRSAQSHVLSAPMAQD
jgi:glycosyltransferase involved in cell wall biosynthesis